MTKADPLMAALRQLGAKTASLRAAPHGVVIAKDHKGKLEDNKGKVEQFGEQLRRVAHGARQEPKPDMKPDIKASATDLMQAPEVADRAAEATDEVTPRSKDRTRRATDDTPHRAAGETTPSPADWRAPESALSSVMSRLDHAGTLSPRDDSAPPRAAVPQVQADLRAMPLNPDELTKDPKAGTLPETSFASSMGAVETRIAPPVKVAVRDQETHFEPVPQLTLLQKIVDRISPDLATAPQPASKAAEVALPDIHQRADTPVRMLTLQLDPPSMGTVTVRMRLAGDAVEVRLSADRQETTQLLRQEQGALVDAMQSAGYTFDIASIDHSAGSNANSNPGQSQTPSDQQQSQPNGGSLLGNGNSERQSNDAQAGARHNRQQGNDQHIKPAERLQSEERGPGRSAGARYL